MSYIYLDPTDAWSEHLELLKYMHV